MGKQMGKHGFPLPELDVERIKFSLGFKTRAFYMMFVEVISRREKV